MRRLPKTAFDRMRYDHADEWLFQLTGMRGVLSNLDVSARESLIWRDLVRGVGLLLASR